MFLSQCSKKQKQKKHYLPIVNACYIVCLLLQVAHYLQFVPVYFKSNGFTHSKEMFDVPKERSFSDHKHEVL